MEFVVTETYVKQKNLNQDNLLNLKNKRKDNVKFVLDQMSKYDHSFEKKHATTIQHAKEHIIKIYQKAGIKLEVDKFPKLFVFEEKDRQKVSEIHSITFDNDRDGRVCVPLGVTAVFINSENIEISASIEHHELEHSIGRFYDILNTSETGVGEVVGYITNNNGEIRGEALEEAIVVNNSILFQEYSDKKIFRLIDRLMLKKIADKYDSVTKGYLPEVYMFYTLVDGVKQIKGDEFSSEFIKDLIAGRIDSKRRFKMQKTVDDVYGSGTARELFRLNSGDEKEILKFTSFLNATINKRKDI